MRGFLAALTSRPIETYHSRDLPIDLWTLNHNGGSTNKNNGQSQAFIQRQFDHDLIQTQQIEKEEEHKSKKDKKWSIGKLFRRKKKSEDSDNTSETDGDNGNRKKAKRKRQKKNRSATTSVNNFDHIVINRDKRAQSLLKPRVEYLDEGVLSDPSSGFIYYRNKVPPPEVNQDLLHVRDDSALGSGNTSLDGSVKKTRKLVKQRAEAIRNSLIKDSSSEDESHNSNSPSRFKSDDSFINTSKDGSWSKRSRGARNERYIKRLSRDDENQLNKEAELLQQGYTRAEVEMLTRTPTSQSSGYGTCKRERLYANTKPENLYANDLRRPIKSESMSSFPSTHSYPSSINFNAKINNNNVKYSIPYKHKDSNRSFNENDYCNVRDNVMNVTFPIGNVSNIINKQSGPPAPPPRDPHRRLTTPVGHNEEQTIQRNDTSHGIINNDFNRIMRRSHDRNVSSAILRRPISNSVDHISIQGNNNLVVNSDIKTDQPRRPASVSAEPKHLYANTGWRNGNSILSHIYRPEPVPFKSEFLYYADQTPRSRRPISIQSSLTSLENKQACTQNVDMNNATNKILDDKPRNASDFWRKIDSEEVAKKRQCQFLHTRAGSESTYLNRIDNNKPKLVNSKPNNLRVFQTPRNVNEPEIVKTKIQTPTHARHKSESHVNGHSYDTRKSPERRKSTNLDEALHELEVIYNSLGLGDEDLLDRAERRELMSPRAHQSFSEWKTNNNDDDIPLRRTLKKTGPRRSTLPDKLNDDMAYRRLNSKGKHINGPKTPQISYMLASPVYLPYTSDDERHSEMDNEPDIVLDDVVYRNIKQTNNRLKVLDPQPPFGIPIGPISPAPSSDYLHATPESKRRSRFIPRKSPDIVSDDLAYRALRKDMKPDDLTSHLKYNNNVMPDPFYTKETPAALKKKRAVRSLSANIFSMVEKEIDDALKMSKQATVEKSLSNADFKARLAMAESNSNDTPKNKVKYRNNTINLFVSKSHPETLEFLKNSPNTNEATQTKRNKEEFQKVLNMLAQEAMDTSNKLGVALAEFDINRNNTTPIASTDEKRTEFLSSLSNNATGGSPELKLITVHSEVVQDDRKKLYSDNSTAKNTEDSLIQISNQLHKVEDKIKHSHEKQIYFNDESKHFKPSSDFEGNNTPIVVETKTIHAETIEKPEVVELDIKNDSINVENIDNEQKRKEYNSQEKISELDSLNFGDLQKDIGNLVTGISNITLLLKDDKKDDHSNKEAETVSLYENDIKAPVSEENNDYNSSEELSNIFKGTTSDDERRGSLKDDNRCDLNSPRLVKTASQHLRRLSQDSGEPSQSNEVPWRRKRQNSSQNEFKGNIGDTQRLKSKSSETITANSYCPLLKGKWHTNELDSLRSCSCEDLNTVFVTQAGKVRRRTVAGLPTKMNSASPDTARAARIEKYKEERRAYFTARTAVLMSKNVTERRPTRKQQERSISADKPHLKTSSELNLNTASPSVTIRQTRASRLREHSTKTLKNTQSLDDVRTKPQEAKVKPMARSPPKAKSPVKEKVIHPDESVVYEKVERFTELFNTSGNSGNGDDVDLLFEKILVENGIDQAGLLNGSHGLSVSPPKPSNLPMPNSSPRRKLESAKENGGYAARNNNRRPLDIKTDSTSLPSTKIVNKCSPLSLSIKKEKIKSGGDSKSPSTSPKQILQSRKKNTDLGNKPSLIPLSRRSAEKENKLSPPKSFGSDKKNRETPPKKDKNDTRYGKPLIKSTELLDNKLNNKSSKQQISQQNEQYQKQSKRLSSSLDRKGNNVETKAKNLTEVSSINKTFNNNKKSTEATSGNKMNLSALQQTITHNENVQLNSRLSQRMDNLAELTKQTIDRVNKLNQSRNVKNEGPQSSHTRAYEVNNGGLSSDSSSRSSTSPRRGRGVTFQDIQIAAQKLVELENDNENTKNCDLNQSSSQNKPADNSLNNGPVSILKRKSITDEPVITINCSDVPPVTFSAVLPETRRPRSETRQKQGILKKRCSLDESQVSQRSCSPEVSFAEGIPLDSNESILKNRRSSLEDVICSHSPDGQIQGILKRRISREDEINADDNSIGSPEPHGILKKKSNSSSSSSTTSSHVSIAHAVILAAASGAEIEDEDNAVRPILKKKSFSEERSSGDNDTPKPILKKKSLDLEDSDRPKKPILKHKRTNDDDNTSSFDLSEDDRSSRRSSLLRSRMSDQSSSECESSIRPILKQRASSLGRERSQSPKLRLSLCDDNQEPNENHKTFTINYVTNITHCPSALESLYDDSIKTYYPSDVVRRRNLRPKIEPRSRSVVCDNNNELYSILQNRRVKLEKYDTYESPKLSMQNNKNADIEDDKPFLSVADRIRCMEKFFNRTANDVSVKKPTKTRTRDKSRYSTQPITMDEMQSITSVLESVQTDFRSFDSIGSSFPRATDARASFDRSADYSVDTSRLCLESYSSFNDPPAVVSGVFGGSSLEELEKAQLQVDRVLDALEADSRALEAGDNDQDNWSLNVSYDSGVYNRASSSNSGPHSGEELGPLEGEILGPITNHYECYQVEHDNMDDGKEVGGDEPRGFVSGLVKSNSVSARASMWQALQEQARGLPRPLLRHNRRDKENIDRYRSQNIVWGQRSVDQEHPDDAAMDSSFRSGGANRSLDVDDEAKLDEDDPAKMSLAEKMRLFNSKLIHKPPMAKKDGPQPKTRNKTMPINENALNQALASRREQLSKSLTVDVPKDIDFQRKMDLFRSASAHNTSIKYIMEKNRMNPSLDEPEPTPGSRRSWNSPTSGNHHHVAPPIPLSLTKGDSSEGLKDEGIDSSSDDESGSVSDVKCMSSSDSSDNQEPAVKYSKQSSPYKQASLQTSRTDSEINRLQYKGSPLSNKFPNSYKLPCANEIPSVRNLRPTAEGLMRRVRTQMSPKMEPEVTFRRVETPNKDLNCISLRTVALSPEKRKFFGLDDGNKKPVPMHTRSLEDDLSDSSGDMEVAAINTTKRGGVKVGATGGLQRSATHSDMPQQRGGTIADRLAALQAAGANEWKTKVCRFSPETEDTKAIERAKNQINEQLNQAVEERKKIQVDEKELGKNILADRRNKLETSAQDWRKRVPQNDASVFSVASRMQRDKVTTPPVPPTPPPSTGGTPTPSPFKSRRVIEQPPANGPLKSASCVNMALASNNVNGRHEPAVTRADKFKRSQSINDSISDETRKDKTKPVSKVPVPRADDETFTSFYNSVTHGIIGTGDVARENNAPDVDLDAIDNNSRQLLTHNGVRRVKFTRNVQSSRNPLRALQERKDLCDTYTEQPSTIVNNLVKSCSNNGLAAEALAALASKEDFSSVSLRSVNHMEHSAALPTLLLLHIKGRRRVQTRLVEAIHSNVNRGDSFVLVTSDKVFHYAGYYSNVIERSRGCDVALHICNTKDLGCKNSTGVITLDEQTNNFNRRQWNDFWSYLGVKGDEYEPVEAGHADEDEIYESNIIHTNMFYELVHDELVPIKEYWGQVPKISMLNQSKIVVCDFGAEFYVWYGKNVPLESRRRAADLAKEMFDHGYNYEECGIVPVNTAAILGDRKDVVQLEASCKTRPKWAIFAKVTQHMESILFKEKFLDWPDFTRVIKVKQQEYKSESADLKPCDISELVNKEYEEPDFVLEGSHLGRGTHYYDKNTMRHFEIKTKTVEKWLIQENEYQKVENAKHISDFYSGDSYIFRWEYQVTVSGRELNGKPSKHLQTGRDRCAYFCWQGKDASSNEKGTAALLTVELDKEKGPQVRVAQGSEPAAFLNLFQGNLVINQGKKSSDHSRFRLYVVRGNISNEAYMLQVSCSMRQLRSRASLILVDRDEKRVYVWHGSRSLKHTKNIALEVANKYVSREGGWTLEEVSEGSEPKVVIDALGGANRQIYCSSLNKDCPGDENVTARLFHFTDLSGKFEANEILSPLRCEHLVTPFPFEQKELYSVSQPAVFMLDDGSSVWLWHGWWPHNEDGEIEQIEGNSNTGAFVWRWQSMRSAALDTALDYCGHRRSKAIANTDCSDAPVKESYGDVKLVYAGLEPLQFTNLFDEWSLHDDAADSNIQAGYKASEVRSGEREQNKFSGCVTLELAILQQRPLPPDVDPAHLERHLTAHDFIEAFGMTKDEFEVLPHWKKTNIKKELGLF